VWCIGESELLERFHLGEVRLLNPPGHRVAIALFHFRLEQRFQITEMTLLLANGLFGHLQKLSTNGAQPQLLGILPDRGLLYGGAHWITPLVG